MLGGVVVLYGNERRLAWLPTVWPCVPEDRWSLTTPRRPRTINRQTQVKRCQGIACVLQALPMLWSVVVRIVWGIISNGQGEGPWHWELSRCGWRVWSPLSGTSLLAPPSAVHP
ncbi:hypothetical protein FA13DRAFT_1263750 [Coprinellus micaceus]|uniref:Uncharacterized protein n=1 Tax=Coprinellus micaceus TaxID=71717 RepID=A0A4Y7R871_COPMI|nr:hypothetical protein FA13DRAFT_1263750 [Coprinellus micaceus]